jgi:hypothetical protein
MVYPPVNVHIDLAMSDLGLENVRVHQYSVAMFRVYVKRRVCVKSRSPAGLTIDYPGSFLLTMILRLIGDETWQGGFIPMDVLVGKNIQK